MQTFSNISQSTTQKGFQLTGTGRVQQKYTPNWLNYTRMLNDIEFTILRHWMRSEDLEHYLRKGLGQGYAECLQFAAALLRFTAYYRTKTKVKKLNIEGINTANDLQITLVNLINHKLGKDECVRGLVEKGHSICAARLRKKAASFKKSSYNLDTLIHGNYRNTHSSKLTELAKILLLSIRSCKGSDVRRTIPATWRRYMRLVAGNLEQINPDTGEIFNKETLAGRVKPISLSTAKRFLNHPHSDMVTIRLRDGEKVLNDKWKPYLEREKVPFSLGMTSSDGHDIGLRLRKRGVDTFQRLVSYLIFDYHSHAIVGYEIGEFETDVENKKPARKMTEGNEEYNWEVGLDTMMKAFKNAISNTGGIIPHENQMDGKGRAHKKELEKLMTYLSFGKTGKSQHRLAESLIGEFEEMHVSQTEGFVGRNVRSKKQNNQRNPDYPQKTYSETEIRKKYKELVYDWNNTIPEGETKTRWELLTDNIDPTCKKLSERLNLELFGGEARKEEIRRGKVHIQVNKVKYSFSVPKHYEVIRNIKTGNGKSVRIRFNERSLSHETGGIACIYNYSPLEPDNEKLDTFLAEVYLTKKAQGAKAYQTNSDLKVIGEHARNNEKMDEYIQEHEGSLIDLQDSSSSNSDNDVTAAEAEAMLSSGYNNLGKDLNNKAMRALDKDEGSEDGELKRGSTKERKFNPFLGKSLEGDEDIL